MPFLLFLFEKFLDAILPDVLKVLSHTHPEITFIAFIEALETIAGKILAFITVLYLALHEQIAFLLEEGALLISWPATDALRHSDSLTPYIISEGKVSAAYSAIHSAGSN